MDENINLNDFDDLPPVLFACNIHEDTFSSDALKSQLEDIFCKFGTAQFVYLPSFRRVRVQFETPEEAIRAKITLHNTNFHNNELQVFFSQISSLSEETSSSLLPPVADKQFLISPPASPPVGWEPMEENKPMFNFDLLSVLMELEPGQSHEVHKATTSTPSVVVHICDNMPLNNSQIIKIPQTRRPGSNTMP